MSIGVIFYILAGDGAVDFLVIYAFGGYLPVYTGLAGGLRAVHCEITILSTFRRNIATFVPLLETTAEMRMKPRLPFQI